MDNHDWVLEELGILIQNKDAKLFLEDHRNQYYKEVKRYLILKQLKEKKYQPLLSIFKK
jgi:hypothetical protein